MIEVGGGTGGGAHLEVSAHAPVPPGPATSDTAGAADEGPAPTIDSDALSTPPEPIHAAPTHDAGGISTTEANAATLAGLGSAPAVETGSEEKPVERGSSRGAGRSGRSSRKRKTAATAPLAPAAADADASVLAAVGHAPLADAATDAVPGAVDSALSQRVETLENGLRRILDEVRKLRQTLADPGEGR